MTFPLSWPERLYGLILFVYPRTFRDQYEHEMRVVFRDLLCDPSVGGLQLAAIMLRDLTHGLARLERLPPRSLAARSAIYGLLIVAFSIAAQVLHPGSYLGVSVVPVPFVAFIAAGFCGARTTGTFTGGMWTCLVIGLVASTTVLWDKVLFGIFPFYDAWSFALSILMMAGFCIGPGIIGSIAGSATSRDPASGSHRREP
jgi:hypothetical protein